VWLLRISTRGSISQILKDIAAVMSIRICACYHTSGVACLNVCVYVCGILPYKWRLIKNLLVQLYFCIRLDIPSDLRMDLFSPSLTPLP
jgi:hypothetical protein